jgi:hypothetical protein
MTHEEVDRYIEELNRIAPFGSGKVRKISVIPWPVKPFETVDYYIDFYLYDINLYASEKLSELTFERFIKCCDTMFYNKTGYEEWKKREIRNNKLSFIE